jgi:ABC-type phosphate/phosphonate transport system substrate-binding protein
MFDPLNLVAIDTLRLKTGYKIKLIVRQKIPRIASMVEKDEVDFVFLNSLLFDGFHQDKKLVPVAQVQNIAGNWFSKSVIFVRGDSKIKTFNELKGVDMSYLGKASPGGYLAPRAVMENKGINTKKDIDELFTRSVSKSIHNVLLGKTKAGAVCNVMFNLLSRKIDTGDLKIIGESENFPESVIGANSKLPPSVIEKVKNTILGMKDSVEGQLAFDNLHKLKIGHFVPYHEESTQMIEKLKTDAQFSETLRPS